MKRVFVILFLVPTIVYAQETLDLKRCVEIALENNYSLQISRNKSEIADNNVTLANAGYLPNVTVDGRYSGSVNNTTQTPVSGDKKTVNGATTQTIDVGPALQWNLFQGFRVKTTYSRLKELSDLGELAVKLQMELLISDIAYEYYNLIYRKRKFDNLHYALSISGERLRLAQTQFELGSRSKLDVLQAQVDFNADSSNLILQQQSILESETRLKTLMSAYNPNTPINIVDTVINVNLLLNHDELTQNMSEHNVRLQTLVGAKKLSELDLKLIHSRSLPYLRFNGSYGYTQTRWGGNSTNSLKVNENLGLNYGLTLGINILDGFNHNRNLKNAKLEIKNSDLAIKDLEQQNNAQLYNVYNSYKNNLNLIRMEGQNFETAKENYETSMERYKLGVLAGIELREAQINFERAQDRLLQAQFRTKVDEIYLIKISGKLIEYVTP